MEFGTLNVLLPFCFLNETVVKTIARIAIFGILISVVLVDHNHSKVDSIP